MSYSVESENPENTPDKLSYEEIEKNWREVLNQVRDQYEISDIVRKLTGQNIKVEVSSYDGQTY